MEARADVLEQPATRRSKHIVVSVTDATDRAPRIDFRVFSGGTGTETLAVWRFDREATRTPYRVSVEADVEEEGTVLVSGRLLADISRALPNRPVEISTDGVRVTVVCGSSRFTLHTMPVEEYPALPAMPDASGTGRRIVFSQSDQRVWLVSHNGDVKRTYPVSGSVTHNLHPGSFHVYSRSRHAVGVDDSGTMQYFVRFTQGPTGAAIGFHSIPVKSGRPLQTRAQLGTPESHGCIRQATPDAIALWHFAPVGTPVVVTA